MFHLPVVRNRIAQFAARFEPHGTGWVYHGDEATGGLPVTVEEREALIADHARILQRTRWIPVIWIIAVAIGLIAWQIRSGASDEALYWPSIALFVLPMPWVIREWRRADRLPMERFGRRAAVTPPRTRGQAVRARVAALPAGIGLMLGGISALLAWKTWPWTTAGQRWMLAEAAAGFVFAAWLLWMKHRAARGA